ncbi:MAG: hypothetical protein K2Y29_08690 [Beijerinckiaceae bacterium]|nr:hypothetical protein [Beijerinckiaceae bacterium]
MSDTNFGPGSSTGYGAGASSRTGSAGVSPQHPSGSGMSYEAQHRYEGQDRARRMGRQDHDEQSYMDQASDMADDAWRGAQDYYDQGTRRVSEWAGDHPNQLWAAIAIAGAFALWMAYRPVFSGSRTHSNFDPSRYRYRRLPRPEGRSAFMERGAASATGRRGRTD